MKKGTLAALGAYICWGLMPGYWKALDHVPARKSSATGWFGHWWSR